MRQALVCRCDDEAHSKYVVSRFDSQGLNRSLAHQPFRTGGPCLRPTSDTELQASANRLPRDRPNIIARVSHALQVPSADRVSDL